MYKINIDKNALLTKFNDPLWSIGFRPFYLLGTFYAFLIIPVWYLYFTGKISLNGPLSNQLWHAHEMIFGFACAILIGFLFTAVHNWTSRPTPQKAYLFFLAALWGLGRLLMMISPSIFTSIIDCAFLPLATLSLAIPILQSRDYKHLLLILLLTFLSVANITCHLTAHGFFELDTTLIYRFCLDVFALFITIITGRIIPFFTNNKLKEKVAKSHIILEIGVLGGALLILIYDILLFSFENPPHFAPYLFYGVALFHFIRLCLWRPHKVIKFPLLFILPLSYSWLPVSLILRGLSLQTDLMPPFVSWHALTVGAMGGLMFAMMTRSSLGHTRRPLRANTTDIGIFACVFLAAVVRVFGPIISFTFYQDFLCISTALWSFAFLLFLLRYTPFLRAPRLTPS